MRAAAGMTTAERSLISDYIEGELKVGVVPRSASWRRRQNAGYARCSGRGLRAVRHTHPRFNEAEALVPRKTVRSPSRNPSRSGERFASGEREPDTQRPQNRNPHWQSYKFFQIFKELSACASGTRDFSITLSLALPRQPQTITASLFTGSKAFPRLRTRGITFSAGPMSTIST